MLRVNSPSRTGQDSYGNWNSSLVPKGKVKSATDLVAKQKAKNFSKSLDNAANAGRTVGGNSALATSQAYDQIQINSAQISNKEYGASDFMASAPGAAAAGISMATDLKGAGVGKTEAGLIGGATAAAAIGGDALNKTGNETAGGALKGAATGASLGMAAGPLGALVGAGVGAVAGGLSGNKKEKEREAFEKSEKERVDKETKAFDKARTVAIGQAADVDKMYSLNKAAGRKRGLLYRSGGKVETPEVEGKEEGKLSGMPFFLGGGVMDVSLKEPSKQHKKTKTPKIFKRKKGGKVTSCSSGCKCTKCGKKPTNIQTIFRRGGEIDLSKENVIVDGASHDELNNTGIKGDKGLPVVQNGIKVAEIESDELVLNLAAVVKIDDLRKKASTGDKEAEKKLGEVLSAELENNTYDYSNVM
jgi:hypothetical protein